MIEKKFSRWKGGKGNWGNEWSYVLSENVSPLSPPTLLEECFYCQVYAAKVTKKITNVIWKRKSSESMPRTNTSFFLFFIFRLRFLILGRYTLLIFCYFRPQATTTWAVFFSSYMHKVTTITNKKVFWRTLIQNSLLLQHLVRRALTVWS